MLCRNENRFSPLSSSLFLFVAITASAAAQSGTTTTQPLVQAGASKPLTLEDAISYSLSHYPAVRVAVERQAAARFAVGLARTAYLPSASVLWQGKSPEGNAGLGEGPGA